MSDTQTPYVPQVGRGVKHASSLAGSSKVAMKNAADWNAPGGGYEQYKAGDAQRERDLPIGGVAPQKPVGIPLAQPSAKDKK